ncbi:hypothetical protein [Pedobacter glucosidilyticus]|jgi:hypothetical protein|uniref:hypothetical protein n=1 Tax=Pedobacter glucosidilyticus TaxID=1122941 RepID=UPI0026F03B2B|nr:hypothetical protein [Pedobacter glucosidilyticus]
MSETKQEFINLIHNSKLKKINAKLKAIDLIDGNFHICYIPSLKLSAYGSTSSEAFKMMKNIVIPDFCETLMSQEKNKILSELKALGWSQSPFFKTELCKSAHIDKEGILRDFDLSENTELRERLMTV